MSGTTTSATRDAAVARRAESLRLLEREVGVLIRRVKRTIGERARLVHPDLQPASYLMLAWLVDSGPVRAADLVGQFAIDKGAVSRQLQHLVELDLVTRVPDPDDRRATLVSASAEGTRRLDEVGVLRRTLLDEHLTDWSADELDAFAHTLERYNQTLNA